MGTSLINKLDGHPDTEGKNSPVDTEAPSNQIRRHTSCLSITLDIQVAGRRIDGNKLRGGICMNVIPRLV